MEYLSEKDYQKIIESAIKLKEEDIAYFFFNLYTNHRATNLNFSNKLEQTINDLEDQLQVEKERKINFEKNKAKNEKKKKINIDWENHIFWYFNGRLNFEYEIFMYNKECFQFTINKMEELKNEYIKFKKLLSNETLPKNKSNLNLKQKTILLNEIGFFDLDKIKDLPNTKKGKLLSIIFECSEKNATDNLTYLHTITKNLADMNKVKSILSELGIEKL